MRGFHAGIFLLEGRHLPIPLLSRENDYIHARTQSRRRGRLAQQGHEAYKKLLGVEATPLMPEDQQKLVAELPHDPEVVKVFAMIAEMGPLPPRK